MKPETQPAYLTLEEASKLTSLSASTLRRRIRRKQIRVWQPGGPGTRLLIPRSELVAPVTSAASWVEAMAGIIGLPPRAGPGPPRSRGSRWG